MENTENNITPSAGPGPVKKGYLLAILAGAVVVLIVAFLWLQKTQAPTTPAPSLPSQTPPTAPPSTAKTDTTSAINSDLQALDVNDLDKEFKAVDADISNL
ncbi:MAG: hypothetical protein HZA37_01880 [Parcubacteria group bacterium]|nr:hypothetical protein [Parcubacteria group bacterium]